jgi:hypothetical protein
MTRRGIHENDDPLLDYYLLRSSVEKMRFEKTLTITAWMHQLKNTRIQLKDILEDAKSNGSFYEVEVATAWVENKFPRLTEDNIVCAIKREDKTQLETKARKSRNTNE